VLACQHASARVLTALPRLLRAVRARHEQDAQLDGGRRELVAVLVEDRAQLARAHGCVLRGALAGHGDAARRELPELAQEDALVIALVRQRVRALGLQALGVALEPEVLALVGRVRLVDLLELARLEAEGAAALLLEAQRGELPCETGAHAERVGGVLRRSLAREALVHALELAQRDDRFAGLDRHAFEERGLL